MHRRAIVSSALVFGLALAMPRAAYACAVCATADPTIAASGEEQPFRGRLRLSADARLGQVDAGGASLDDRRVEIATAWAPIRALEISLSVPYLFRELRDASSFRVTDYATLGDVELRATMLAYESRGAFGRRRFGLLAALKLPTSPIENGFEGEPLSSVLEPGCGAIAPTLGAYYSASRGAWSTFTSVSLFLPFQVREGPHSGDSARASFHVQFQPTPRFAGRLGAFARLDASGNLTPAADDPNSGGFIGYVTSEIAIAPISDLVITIGAFLPVIEALRGAHHESAIAALTVAYDF
jgi:hypothetical protein